MLECIKYVSSNAINRLIIHNLDCQMEVMMFQICRTDSVPNFEIPFQNSKKNDHFNVIVL